MATASTLRHTIKLPLHPTVLATPSSSETFEQRSTIDADPKAIAEQWLACFAKVIASPNASQTLGPIIHPQAWWRDHLALSWDLRTLHGRKAIVDFAQNHSVHQVELSDFEIPSSGVFQPKFTTPIQGLDWIETMFFFKTKHGSGKGMLRLAHEQGSWRAHMIYTALQSLYAFPERVGDARPDGGNNSLKGGIIEGNWAERLQRQQELKDEEPTVLVIGAGQAGLNLAARLQAVRISALLIDKNQRVGDNWRHRYRTLVTHDPVHYSHMAYMPFPTTWPMFTPKDKLADWLEAYAKAMECNIWLNTKVESAEYSEKTQSWTVNVRRSGSDAVRTVHPKHLVFSTGHAGEPRVPQFPGQEQFEGKIYHGSQHQDASMSGDAAQKKVVVVGTGNSGHDIAQNYYENGAVVTMLQRSGTYVITARKGLFMLHAGLYEENGPPTDDADIYGQSLPIPVQFALNVASTAKITGAEKATLDGLTAAGFKLDFGHDGSGIYRKYITRGGGYYIDVGASDLIIQGKIKVEQSPNGISHFDADGIVLANGRKLAADVVVLATGFDNMRTTLRKTLGDRVADRANDVWDLDDEGEVNAMWRPSGHPRFWYMGGSLALCRSYSRLLALQIQAIEAGLNPSH